MMPLNVEHFNKVLGHIRGDNRRLLMQVWGIKKDSYAYTLAFDRGYGNTANSTIEFASCGTACCFAGWSLLLSLPEERWTEVFLRDGRLNAFLVLKERDRLGLSRYEAAILFEPVGGEKEAQLAEVESRIRKIVHDRELAGDLSGLGILV